MRAERERREAARQRFATERREAMDRVDRIQLVINALGAKLACTPDDEAIEKAFHDACGMLHKAELTAEGIKRSAEAQRGIPQWATSMQASGN